MKLFDFSALRRSVQSAAEQLKDLQQKEELLRRQRDAVKAGRAAKEDIKAMVLRWIDSRSAAYGDALQSHLRAFIAAPEDTRNPTRLQAFSPLGAVQPYGEALGPSEVDTAMCALFAPQLREALTQAIDAMTWDEGLPLAQRTARLAELDEQLHELSLQQSQLIQSAEEAGVRLY